MEKFPLYLQLWAVQQSIFQVNLLHIFCIAAQVDDDDLNAIRYGKKLA